MKFKNTLYIIILTLVLGFTSCEQEGVEPVLTTEIGAGTLTTYKAYTLDAMMTGPDSTYGRVVFWEAIDASSTLVQLSLYNVADGESLDSDLFSGTIIGGSTTVIEDLPAIENTGEGYDFGEFVGSKFYIINDASFFGSLSDLDAYVAVMSGSDMICGGDIGVNATPVEEN